MGYNYDRKRFLKEDYIKMIRKIIGYLIGGFLFGVYNECYFEPMWDYSTKLIWFILGDVPVVSLIGWPIIITLLLLGI